MGISHAGEGAGAPLRTGSEKNLCCVNVSVVVPASQLDLTVISGRPGLRMNDEMTSATGFELARSIERVKSSAAVLPYAFDAM